MTHRTVHGSRLGTGLTRLVFLLGIALILGSCAKYTSPSPLDGIWLVDRVESTSTLPTPVVRPGDAVYWEFQNVLFRITYNPAGITGQSIRQLVWGYPTFDRDRVTFVPADELMGKASFPVPGGTLLPELTLRYETARGRLTMYGEGYTIYLIRR